MIAIVKREINKKIRYYIPFNDYYFRPYICVLSSSLHIWKCVPFSVYYFRPYVLSSLFPILCFVLSTYCPIWRFFLSTCCSIRCFVRRHFFYLWRFLLWRFVGESTNHVKNTLLEKTLFSHQTFPLRRVIERLFL